MEERGAGPAAQGQGARFNRRDLLLIALLLGAALGLRSWHLTHTEVAARDSIGYIRYAWQLVHHPWLETIGDPRQEQHPGYPLAIAVMSYPVKWLAPGPAPEVMQLSAQLVSAIASVLLVLPMFLLGRALFHRSAGFWATLIFQCLPASGRILTDGLSEGLFLFLVAVALLAAVWALQSWSPRWFAVTGVFSALAYLTRPEGALIAGTTGVVLVGAQCVRAWRAPWPRLLACATALTLATGIVGSPLYAITGKLTVKPTPLKVLLLHASPIEPTQAPPLISLGGGNPSDMPLFAVWLTGDGHHVSSSGFKAVVTEFVKGNLYVLWVPLLLGLWWFRQRLFQVPGAWVLLLVSLTVLGLMWRVASIMGYVSDRHLLLPLLCGLYWAVAAVPLMVTQCAAVLGRWPGWLPAAAHPIWALLTLGTLTAVALPHTLEPLHANRDGFRDAGLWLAEHARPWDEVIDPYCWSHYYAGKVFLEPASPEPPPGETKMHYAVIEHALNEHPRHIGDIQRAEDCAKQGYIVKSWSGHRGSKPFEVVIYEAP